VANALTAGTYLTSGGTFDGAAARTFAVDATSANTASKVVARDASGNFSAGTITATLSGAATSATTATNLAGGTANQIPYQASAGTTSFATAPSATGQVLSWNGSAFAWATPAAGTVTTVGWTGGIVTVTNPTTTPAFTIAGTSGGIPYFSSGTAWATSAALTANALVIGGGAGAAPATTTTGTGVVTALGNATNATGGLTTVDGTATLTNKRITPRVVTTTSSATPSINTDTTDVYGLTAQAVDITSFTTNLTGTPTNGQKLWIYIVGTAARAITWGASFEASTTALPTTTVTTARLDVGFVWNSVTSKWRCMAVA
jgi:hypothetical protein